MKNHVFYYIIVINYKCKNHQGKLIKTNEMKSERFLRVKYMDIC